MKVQEIDSTWRWQAARSARKLIGHGPVYLDTETTGLDENDEIIEICIVKHDGKIVIDSLVKPTKKIPLEATEKNGITDEMVAAAPTWPQIWPMIRKIISGRRVMIYNADYDVRMMQQSHAVNSMRWRNPERTEFHCVMNLYAQFYGEWNYQREDWKWQKLGLAAEQCGINLPNAHRAKADAILAREILQHMANAR